MKAVRVVDYDAGWPESYDRARRQLEAILLSDSVSLHHVGSTSVPGLAAKPVIDIIIEVPCLDVLDTAVPSFIGLGYESRGEYGIEGRRYFSRPAGVDLKVHVHGFAAGHPQILGHLVFRDYLRTHPTDAHRYADLKRALSGLHRDDRDAYQAAKAALVEQLHLAAFRWHTSRSGPGEGVGAAV